MVRFIALCLFFSGCKPLTETITEIEYVDVNVYLAQDGRFASGGAASWADPLIESRVLNAIWVTKVDSADVGIVRITAWYYDRFVDAMAGSSAIEIMDDYIWITDSLNNFVWTTDEYYVQSPDFVFYGLSVEVEKQ